jgi:hypothetical protein
VLLSIADVSCSLIVADLNLDPNAAPELEPEEPQEEKAEPVQNVEEEGETINLDNKDEL